MCGLELSLYYELLCVEAFLFHNDAVWDVFNTEEDDDLCFKVIEFFGSFNKNANTASMPFALYYVQLLLPVVVFLMFDDPHDCFKCLGKDPERKYSRFQLSVEERKNRRMIARYSVNNLMSNQPLV